MGAVESVGKSCVGTVGTVGTVGMTLMSGICRLSGTVGFMSGYVGNCRARAQLIMFWTGTCRHTVPSYAWQT